MDRSAGRPRRGQPCSFYGGLTEDFAAFAAHQFALSAKQDDGKPLREHLDAYRDKTGRLHPTIANGPKLPAGLGYLWRDFLDLHSERGQTMGGYQRITSRDLHYWQVENGVTLEAWEKRAIRKADTAFLDANAKKG